jgi:2Fe-2S ferredoxin
MTQIIFLPHEKFCPDGLVTTAEAGQSILDVAHGVRIPIETACGGATAGGTCHVIIREGFDSLNEADELEEDYLDRAWGLEPQSRLSFQARVGTEDLILEIPRYSLNHAG